MNSPSPCLMDRPGTSVFAGRSARMAASECASEGGHSQGGGAPSPRASDRPTGRARPGSSAPTPQTLIAYRVERFGDWAGRRSAHHLFVAVCRGFETRTTFFDAHGFAPKLTLLPSMQYFRGGRKMHVSAYQ